MCRLFSLCLLAITNRFWTIIKILSKKRSPWFLRSTREKYQEQTRFFCLLPNLFPLLPKLARLRTLPPHSVSIIPFQCMIHHITNHKVKYNAWNTTLFVEYIVWRIAKISYKVCIHFNHPILVRYIHTAGKVVFGDLFVIWAVCLLIRSLLDHLRLPSCLFYAYILFTHFTKPGWRK